MKGKGPPGPATVDGQGWPINRTYLPRLSREYYQGDAVVLWTLTVLHRASGWLDESFLHRFREVLFHSMARQGLICPIYCLMPDHLHLVWMGLQRASDQFKAMSFLRTHLEPRISPAKFQSQAHDHVLKESERRRNAFAKVCFYVGENPVRAGLVATREDWPFTGCLVPGYPSLAVFEEDYWPKFWRIYQSLKEADAGDVRRPSY